MPIFDDNNLQRRRARAVGRKFFEICQHADPSLRTGIELITNQPDALTSEQRKIAAILRIAWEEGLVGVGQELLDAAAAVVD